MIRTPVYTETKLPTFDEVNKANGGADLAKSHLPAGVESMVNGVPYSTKEVETFQTVNGVTRPAGTVKVVK